EMLGVAPGAAAGTVADRLADLFPLVFAIVPIVLFAGVLRYRLFDIDRLVSRVLVYGLIVIGSGVVYLVAVVTGGVLVGGAGWWTVIVLAAAAVALAPAWSLARRWANRVVFGQELDPQAALQALMSGLEQVAPAAELDQLVEVSVRATRAVGAQLWVLDDAGWTARASAPAGRSTAATEPDLRPGRHWPVMHKDERLGVLTVQLDGAETLPAADRALLADLAAHAGLLVYNAVLAVSLAHHVEELADRARQLAVSRRRMVAAQDRERRRIERDLHDGAQQTLVAVMLGLRMASAESTTPVTRVSLLRQLTRELDVSRNDLSAIAGGQLPSALVEGGLQGGLVRAADKVRRTGIAVDLSVDLKGAPEGAPDLDPDLLGAVYFCCSEALQNVVKYAKASRASVDVRVVGADIVFEITDDGIGIDPSAAPADLGGIRGLDDRASLHGGWIVVDSAPGRGTRLHGAIPVGGS
ncbi:MAG TPA: ATP-binding protein, partial [Nakamurella sp.]